MKGKPSRGLYTEDELKKHKKGKDYIAQKTAEQKSLEKYEQIEVEPVPKTLCRYGKKEWRRIIPLLQELPIAELDRELIESYCILHGSRRRLQDDVKTNGETYSIYDEEGNVKSIRRNPSYDMLLSTVKELRMIANQLGMTINSRLELAMPEEEKKEDEIMKLIKGG